MPIHVNLVSLGCSKNLVDSECMLHKLQKKGYVQVADPALADVIIVNTCGFIESAQQEAVDTILEMSQYKESGRLSVLAVTGCMAQMFGAEVQKELPEVDVVLGTGSYARIVEGIEQALAGKSFAAFDPITCGVMPSDGRVLTTPAYVAYLKISEGCSNRCAYCAIPSLRGPFRSRPMEEIVKEAEFLAKSGIKELVVIAQDTTKYGVDLYGSYKIHELLQKLCQIDGFRWIRLHYCYPDKITDALLETMAREDKILPYFDIPIQHCSDRILRLMNRGLVDLPALIAKIRSALPAVTLRTSLITGFPTETEEEFEQMCSFIKEIKFDRLGVFAFSPQDGTPAAAMDGQIDEEEKQRRLDILMRTQAEISDAGGEAQLGKTLTVLCEGAEEGRYVGRSYRDSLDVDPKVYFTSPTPILEGDFVKVLITGHDEYDLFGEVRA